MRKQSLSLYLSLICSIAVAQNKDAITYGKAISIENACKHLTILASDEYQGRETGMPGEQMAASYIENQFKAIGLNAPLTGSYVQEVNAVDIQLQQSLNINGKQEEAIRDFFNAAPAVSLSGFNITTDSIFFAGYGLIDDGYAQYNDYLDHEIAGKVVMIIKSGPMDGTFSFQDKIRYLTIHHARAVLVIEPLMENKPDYLLKYLYTDQMIINNTENIAKLNAFKQEMPVIFISNAVANHILVTHKTNLELIKRQLEESKKPAPLEIKVSISTSAKKTLKPLNTRNVMGFLEGTDQLLKHEVLVISAHYDHLGIMPYLSGTDKINNGADDNGSGTTAVLLIAEAFKNAAKAGKGPKRSILFLTVTGEEKGLLGSTWYTDHPVFPLTNTIADLNIDMIGRGDDAHKGNNNFVYIIGADRLSTDLDSIVKKTNVDYLRMALDEKYNDPKDPEKLYYRSDHYNFAKHGIPVTFYFNGLHIDYHRPGDEVNKIDFPALSKRARLIYFTAWELANAAQRPKVDKNMNN